MEENDDIKECTEEHLDEHHKKKDKKRNLEILSLTNKVEELRLENDNLTKTMKELNNQLLLEKADSVNYRKRKDEEVQNKLKYANQDLILDELDILDNFERAVKSNSNNNEEINKFLTGFQMIYNQLSETLKKYGVEELDVIDKEYDANTSEALLVGNDESKDDGVVLDVLQKGYSLKGKIIRPAKVRVNQR